MNNHSGVGEKVLIFLRTNILSMYLFDDIKTFGGKSKLSNDNVFNIIGGLAI